VECEGLEEGNRLNDDDLLYDQKPGILTFSPWWAIPWRSVFGDSKGAATEQSFYFTAMSILTLEIERELPSLEPEERKRPSDGRCTPEQEEKRYTLPTRDLQVRPGLDLTKLAHFDRDRLVASLFWLTASVLKALGDSLDDLAGFLLDEWPGEHFLINCDVAARDLLVTELRLTFDHDAADFPLADPRR